MAATEKDRIIIEQQYTITSLATDADRLRRERDELLDMLRGLGTRGQCTSVVPEIKSAVPAAHHGISWDSGLDNPTLYAPQICKSTSQHSALKSSANRTAPPLQIGGSRQRTRSGGANVDRKVQNSTVNDGCWDSFNTSQTFVAHVTNQSISSFQSVSQIRTSVQRADSRPANIARQRSFKRPSRGNSESRPQLTDKNNYELSHDMQAKQLEILERKYGGPVKTKTAAEIIQNNFRQYSLSKNFDRLRSTRDNMRLQRMMSDVSSEKDSVWSEVTITSNQYPPPSSHYDADQSHIADRAFMMTLPGNQPTYRDQTTIYHEPSIYHPTHDPEVCSNDSFSSHRAVANVPVPNYKQSISQEQSSSNDRLHIVNGRQSLGKSRLDSNENIATCNSPQLTPPLVSYGSHSDCSLQSGDVACCQSSDSTDTQSVDSDTISYARNMSINESRMGNIRVQFNRCSEKERKRQYKIGLNLFNQKPERGIKYFMEQRFLDNSSRAVARFLLQRKGLSKQMVGEYLGNLQDPFNQDVLVCVVQELDFTDLEIDQALRKIISFFRLPGEAQKIERIIERFAQRFCVCNPVVTREYKSVDTIFLLSFAIIMLNTDLHNPNIKPCRKMKLEGFVKNLKGIDSGEDVPTEMLIGIYERIQEQELKTGADHTTQVRKVEETMVGKVPQLVASHRRLVCYCRLYEVQDPNRKEKNGVHQREVFLFNDTLVITKIFAKKKSSITYSFRQSISLNDILVQSFSNEHYQFGMKILSKLDRKEIINFNARNQHDKDNFTDDLMESIAEMNEMNAMRISDELRKHSADNRLSKDSGVVDIEGLHRPASYRVSEYSNTSEKSARLNSEMSEETKKRLSNGSVDSGMISTSTGSMASREDSPNLQHKNKYPNGSLHSPPVRAPSQKQSANSRRRTTSQRQNDIIATTSAMI